METKINPKTAFRVRPKFKIYLDTNLFYEDLREWAKNPDKIKEGSKIKFFRTCYHLMLYTSILGKAELSRELKSAYGLNEKDIDNFWRKFCSLIGLKVIKQYKMDERIDEIAKKVKLRRGGILNAQHLFIAKDLGLWFVTGDSFIKEYEIKRAYEKSLGYTELRKMVAKECKFEGRCEHTKNCHE